MDEIIQRQMTKQNEEILRIKAVFDRPNAKGYWELIDVQEGSTSKWNVLYNNNWPLPGSGGWIATNGIRTCMCSSLRGKWRKLSNVFQPGEDIGSIDIYKNARIKKGL